MRENSFRSAILEAPGRIRTDRCSMRTPGPTQVRVRLQGCGVCGSNLAAWEGRPWFQYPFAPGAPGHEGWGVVEAAGERVDTLAAGDRVAMISHNAFAELDVAEAADAVKLPGALDDKPFPGEALACAMNAFRRCDIQPGQWVAVVGVGFLGALLVELAASAGGRVIGMSGRPFALDVARRMGAEQVVPTNDHWAAVGAVKEITQGRGCERVIEVTGFQQPLDLASDLVAERGTLIIAGYHQDGPRQVNMQSWNWRGIDVINAHERDPRIYTRGLREAVEAVSQGRLNPWPLYTDQYPLDGLSDALRAMSERPDQFLKALVTL